MPPLPIIQCLWIGNRLSALERLSLSSFLHHGHAVHLYVYGDVAKVPDGVVLRDAAAILPANRIFTYQNRNSYAGFANLFRYKLLCEQGGCWADADMICLAPIAHLTEHLFVSEHIGDARRRRGWLKRLITRKAPPCPTPTVGINNCFIQASTGSAIMAHCYHMANQKDPKKIKWGETGPRLLATALAQFNLESCVTLPEAFCPIACSNWRQAIEANPSDHLLKGAQCVHLWNEMWRRNEIDKDGTFPSSSLYEQLKQRYL